MNILWKIVLATVVGSGAIHGWIKLNQDKFDRFVMGIIRDLGRHKARKRRMAAGSGTGLIQTLLRQDDPMQDLLLARPEDEDILNLPTYTDAELEEFGDGLDGRPILIAIFGRVYDVSAGARFYGPTGTYKDFAGRDVTYSLCTGCRTLECLENDVEQVVEEKLLDEGKRWLAFFHLHDKYKLVGKLEVDYLETIIMKEVMEEHKDDAANLQEGGGGGVGGQQRPPPLNKPPVQ